eukprot:10522793-Alexandrium_andersonii.AAC.1
MEGGVKGLLEDVLSSATKATRMRACSNIAQASHQQECLQTAGDAALRTGPAPARHWQAPRPRAHAGLAPT